MDGLLPAPRSASEGPGNFVLPERMWIVMEPRVGGAGGATRDLFAAERFEIEAETLTDTQIHVAISGQMVDEGREIRVLFDENVADGHEQGYGLTIRPTGIEIRAKAAAGVFYAFQTLMQIVRQAAFAGPAKKAKKRRLIKLPCVIIEDWPDYQRRGVYHDCARGKIPTVDTLLQLIDDLGHLKINEFQLYVENGFEFRKHPEMWDDTTPFTAEEILLLDSACKARHIDFVPSLTSLGHFERILYRPAFRHLAEAEPEQLKAIGAKCWVDVPWSLCVTDPEAKAFLKDMYDEFVPNFSSGMFNICCDEAYDLGKVRSKELADKIGVPQMYVDWINFCDGMAKGYGKSIQIWGDIILHHAELIPQLPKDAVLLEWGYEADHNFDEHCATIAERIKGGGGGGGQKFYVAPGTASWMSFTTRSKVAFGNIHNAAEAGLKHGAMGLLVTDWGDFAHQQLLSVSLNAFAYGAAASWNLASVPNPAKDPKADLKPVLAAISLHLYQDPSASFGRLAYDAGMAYELIGWQRFNATLEWWLFREKWDFANYVNRAPAKDLPKVIAWCEKLIPKIKKAELQHPDAEKIKAELALSLETIIHTCKRTTLRKAWLAADPAKRNPEEETLRALPAKPLPKTFKRDIKALAKDAAGLESRYKNLWMARNKRSRVEDVLQEFRRMRDEYKALSK